MNELQSAKQLPEHPYNCMHPKVDAYIAKAEAWKKEMAQLRVIMLDTGLMEDFKWGKPCYSFEGTNIVVIQGFKAYCALLFFKGYMLQDPDNILIKTGANTRVGRQIRFANLREVIKHEKSIRAYINEAIVIERSGIKPTPEAIKEPGIPVELKKIFKSDPAFRDAFKALTPGRRRGYLIHFSAAKQSSTREARISKSVKKIMLGKGLND